MKIHNAYVHVTLIILIGIVFPMSAEEKDRQELDFQKAVISLKGEDILEQVKTMRDLLRGADRDRLDLPSKFKRVGENRTSMIAVFSLIAQDGEDGLPKREGDGISDKLLLERKFLAVFLLGRFDQNAGEKLINQWVFSDNPYINDFARRIKSDMKESSGYSVVLTGLSSGEAIEVLENLSRSKLPALRRAAVVNACALLSSDIALRDVIHPILIDMRKREKEPEVRLALVENVGNLGVDDPFVMSYIHAFAEDDAHKDSAWRLAKEVVDYLQKSDISDGEQKRVDLRKIREEQE